MITQHIVSALVLAIPSLVLVGGRMYLDARDVTDIVSDSIAVQSEIAEANGRDDAHELADAIVDQVRFTLDEGAWARSKGMHLGAA